MIKKIAIAAVGVAATVLPVLVNLLLANYVKGKLK